MTAVESPAPSIGVGRRATAVDLVRAGRLEESLPLWRDEVASGPAGADWVRAGAVEAMAWRDLSVAGRLAQLYSAARWGSRWYPGPDAEAALALPVPAAPPRDQLSVLKLRHDIDQFRHLRDRGVLGVEFDEIIDAYAEIVERLLPAGIEARAPLDGHDRARIGHVYNRIVHLAPAARTGRTLSSTWDPAAVERRYLGEPPGLVVIDDFLSPAALDAVRRFCIESTVWSGIRYAEGRLGAFFVDGFNAPLLLQLAEEIRAALPRVLGEHPLRQLWAFKNASTSGVYSNTHADFAAVNVNFWITPTTANLDADTGGLVVYDVAAPLSWDFKTYNERPDVIADYLKDRGARAIRIPYRANRAIIFNSDLFHATEPVRFSPGYEHRRVNVTLLYGDRADDRHHRSLQSDAATLGVPAWRSGSLARTRR